MLTKKSIDIFDTDVLKKGQIISIAKLTHHAGSNEPLVYPPVNGIIRIVEEHKLIVSFLSGDATVNVSDVCSHAPKIKILGIRDYLDDNGDFKELEIVEAEEDE